MKRTFILLFCAALLYSAPAEARQRAPKSEKVRNVILMIGDGMGLGQTAALMIENGYEPTAFDRADATAICKTYSANNRVTDSGASATAMATGYKTANSRIGVLPDGTAVANLTELAKAKGLATGIVVTSHLADATPAGFVAHVSDRHDSGRIAEMFAEADIDVLAGGGRQFFTECENGRDLLQEMQRKGYVYAPTVEDFYAADRMPVVGLFAPKYMKPASRRGDYLARATEHALNLLAGNKKGFFAMIEGSQIDGACHGNNLGEMMAEMHDFEQAVGRAFDFADTHAGTLVLVVGDHETGGLTVISNNRDFTASESGIAYNYSTTSHSGTPVVLYAYGAGAGNFTGVMENTDIFNLIKALLIGR
ncbi:MAG: alkaline phosphatase [Alistipes sp.]|nr:alkaline phosphatase [Alistipes sp.]